MKMTEDRSERSNQFGTIAIGAVLIFFGVVFLFGQLFGVRTSEWMWPFFIIIPGLLFFAGMIVGGPSAGGLAIPGSIITTIGLLLFFQNTFNYYESWAYAWALIPLAVGFGIVINGYWSKQSELVAKGFKTMQVGAVMFLIGFAFFELVLRIGRVGGFFMARTTGPLLLIALGAFLVWRNLIRQSHQEPPSPMSQPLPPSNVTTPTSEAAPPPVTPFINIPPTNGKAPPEVVSMNGVPLEMEKK